MNPELVGGIAGIMTTASFLPQVAMVVRTRDTRSISLWMYVIYVTGIFLWGVYGLAIGSDSIIAANAITFLLAGVILMFKIREVRSAKE